MSPEPRNGIGDVDPLADLKPRADRPAVLDQRSQARQATLSMIIRATSLFRALDVQAVTLSRTEPREHLT